MIGKTGEDPFVGFVLASNSLPYRKMECRESENKKRIYVLPREGYESDNIKFPEVDNYAGIIGEIIPRIKNLPGDISGSVLFETLIGMKKHAMIAFNGHMAKRCMSNIKDGMKPNIALDSTLFEFRGMPKDPRIGGVIYIDGDEIESYIGVNDADRSEKRITPHRLSPNLGIYTYASDTSIDRKINLPIFNNASELVKFISTEMIDGIEKVLAGGVCVKRGEEFETAVYNTPIEDIKKWIQK